MKKITLEELFPAKPEFHVKSIRADLAIRPPNLLDQMWMKEKFGSHENLQKLFANGEWGEVVKIVYHQLSESDKDLFPATKVRIRNDDGEEAHVVMTGPEMLLQALTGMEEVTKMIGAMNRAWVLSFPEAEAAVTEAVKKNLKALQEKQPETKTTGDTLPTKSRRNTDTQKTKSVT